MEKVRSKDGTLIAYEKTGSGPALILVDGALCYRSFGPSPKLVPLLAKHFTVVAYDRRGRDDSTSTQPYAPEREVEDLAALIDAAGGSAYVFGLSSGAALSLEAANSGLPITKLALYEAPFIVDNERTPLPADFLDKLNDMLAVDDRGGAVRAFMKLVGMPAIIAQLMRFFPGWSKLKAVAHTLPHDMIIMKDYQQGKPLPRDRWTSVTAETTVMFGGKSPAWMKNGAKNLAEILPGSELRVLPGQTHMIKAPVLAPVLIDVFNGQAKQETAALKEQGAAA
jgi:pimeloyl-ACP methyl ester carboxylesterase